MSATIARDKPTQSPPRRKGPTPKTTVRNPQQQLDQIPDAAAYQAFRDVISDWPGVIKAPSMRAPHGTIGLYLDDDAARGPGEAFLLGTEFAHLHPLPDGSLHMVLPEDVKAAAVAAGWGLAHPLAGTSTVSPQTTLIFAPRDAEEREVVAGFVRAAEHFARGR